ncbi:MAG: CDP-alcohol phosphatidyltransferase family protein [Clostridiales bacterium]|nr:CDP-alcohol phosphatidyltransferase family protein [Clostridiales bacterium]
MKCESKHIVGFWHYGVILTYLATALGVTGIIFSMLGMTDAAVLCLLHSGLCDAFDGVVARTRRNRSDRDKAFGIQIDSLSDLIAFGVAPVMIGVSMGMTAWYYIILFVAYALCALVRLAYYNVTEEERTLDPEAGNRQYFDGLPVTQISLILPVVYFVATMFGGYHEIIPHMIMLALYTVYMCLMVLKIKLPKPHVKGLVIMIVIFLASIAAMMAVRWTVFDLYIGAL